MKELQIPVNTPAMSWIFVLRFYVRQFYFLHFQSTWQLRRQLLDSVDHRVFVDRCGHHKRTQHPEYRRPPQNACTISLTHTVNLLK